MAKVIKLKEFKKLYLKGYEGMATQEQHNRMKDYLKMKRVIRYLKENERSLSWLARQCDVSPTTAHYWAIGKNRPTNKHKVLIEDATGIEL